MAHVAADYTPVPMTNVALDHAIVQVLVGCIQASNAVQLVPIRLVHQPCTLLHNACRSSW